MVEKQLVPKRWVRVFNVAGSAGLMLLGSYGAVAQQQTKFENTLMPQPAEVRVSGGSVAISPGLTTSLNGANSPVLRDAVLRMLGRLETETGVALDKNLQTAGGAGIDVKVQDTTAERPAFGVDESYSLDVQDGKVALQSKTIFGAMHGFETLLQLVQTQDSKFVIPAVHIVDAPRFPWRGLMLDSGRHFLPIEQILRTLDGMAAVKMNVLHWHLTENQGFRIESLRFPKLQELGSDGLYYTQQQVREIVRYATARGIRVVPEFDMPGHSTTWLIGYPELASRPGPYHIERQNGVFDAVLDPTRESTYRFLDGFLGEMAELFPDEYMHIGGDESTGKDWKENPAIVAFMQQHGLKDTDALQTYFNGRVYTLLKKHHKQMVGWDEILHPDLSPEVVVQNWHGIKYLIDGVRQGHRGLLSQPWYLDHMRTAAEMYAADPVPAGTELSAAESKLVLGGEACMWAEHITGATADSRIWPRSAAIAERMWSPGTTRDADDMYRRLAVMSLRLDALGLTHISGPERGLRQLAGSEAGAWKLGVLASVLQPVDFSERYKQQHTSALTPMGRLVDFVRPDPPAQHDFRMLVESYLHDTASAAHESYRRQLEETFRSWINTAPTLDALAATRPLIAEVKVRREELPRLGLLGLEAMGYVEAHSTPSTEWIDAQTALLKKAGEHVELTDFVVLGPLSELVSGHSASAGK